MKLELWKKEFHEHVHVVCSHLLLEEGPDLIFIPQTIIIQVWKNRTFQGFQFHNKSTSYYILLYICTIAWSQWSGTTINDQIPQLMSARMHRKCSHREEDILEKGNILFWLLMAAAMINLFKQSRPSLADHHKRVTDITMTVFSMELEQKDSIQEALTLKLEQKDTTKKHSPWNSNAKI